MLGCSKHAIIQPKTFREPIIFIASVPRGGGGVDGVVEIGVCDVNLPGRDADYGPVGFVEGDDFEGVLAAEKEIIIGFVAGVF